VPIKKPSGDIGVDVLRQHVPGILTRRQATRPDLLKAIGGGSVDFAGQHAVYVASISDALDGQVLTRARQIGWRYLVVAGNQPLATAQVATKGAGEITFSHVNYGQMAASTLKAIDVADRIPSTEDFDLRVLEIPSLFFVTLWLKSATKEILIPLEPAPPELKANTPYDPKKLLPVLKELAGERLRKSERASDSVRSAATPAPGRTASPPVQRRRPLGDAVNGRTVTNAAREQEGRAKQPAAKKAPGGRNEDRPTRKGSAIRGTTRSTRGSASRGGRLSRGPSGRSGGSRGSHGRGRGSR
jgi:hypothetical protein